MNNSIGRKINENYKTNSNQSDLSLLSSTSSEFITKLNYNKKTIKHKGGNCCCKDLFESINNQNYELILYILKKNDFCFKCKNYDGNTCLHLLIPFYNQSNELANEINNIILNNDDCKKFINVQNNQGQTPMLIAVMNNLNELAEIMENRGANPSIEDNEGNFIGLRLSRIIISTSFYH